MQDMVKNKSYDFVILGSGMAGLGAGVVAARLGYSSIILEKENEIGGLCKNKTISDCDFDFGPKILLLDDSENSREILSYLNGNYEKYPVVESVYLSDFGLVGFPLQRYLVDLPINIRKEILFDLEKAHQNPQPVSNFKTWLMNCFGKSLCELVLFPYEEKKWQVNLNSMDYHWALKRPIKIDKDEILRGSTQRLEPNRFYYYPKRGNISELTRAISKKVGKIVKNAAVKELDIKGHRVITQDGTVYSYKHLVSTLPLDFLIKITSGLPIRIKTEAREILKRLSILVVNLVFKGTKQLKGTAIYFPEKKFIFRRVSILQNLCPALSRTGYIPVSVEISKKPGTNIDKKEILRETLKGLLQIPQFKRLGSPFASDIMEIDFAYPLQVNGLSEFVNEVHKWYETKGVYNCGRGGSYDYCNSDQAYKQGVTSIHNALNRN